jgi:hypothetical protein
LNIPPQSQPRILEGRATLRDSRGVLLFSFLLLLLAVKGDGHFPLPLETPEIIFEVYCSALAILFAIGLVWFLQNGPVDTGSVSVQPAAWLVVLFLVVDCGVLWLEVRRYAPFGYSWHPLLAFTAASVPILGIGWLSFREKPLHPARLLGLAVAGHVAFTAYACAYFPLSVARSDMLPLLMQSGGRLLAGHNPYGLYELGRSTPEYLTYLPGLVVAYLPASFYHLDPRLVGLTYTVLASVVLYHWGGRALSALMSLFLVSPYLIYRHDNYLSPVWLLLAVAACAVSNRRRLSGLAAGLLAVTSQLLWVPALVMVVLTLRRRCLGTRRAVIAGVAAVAIPAAGLAICDLDSFVAGVWSHWRNALDLKSLNLAYWVLALGSPWLLRLIQILAFVALLGWLSRRTATREVLRFSADAPPYDGRGDSDHEPASDARRVFQASSLALFGVCVFNSLSWTYFYLVVLFLAMLAQRAPTLSTGPCHLEKARESL